jgi:alpha-maltose-1-phosphate synthase
MMFVPPGDPPALAGAIRETLDDPRASAARADAANARYLREYRWTVSAERYTRLLDRLAGDAC